MKFDDALIDSGVFVQCMKYITELGANAEIIELIFKYWLGNNEKTSENSPLKGVLFSADFTVKGVSFGQKSLPEINNNPLFHAPLFIEAFITFYTTLPGSNQQKLEKLSSHILKVFNSLDMGMTHPAQRKEWDDFFKNIPFDQKIQDKFSSFFSEQIARYIAKKIRRPVLKKEFEYSLIQSEIFLQYITYVEQLGQTTSALEYITQYWIVDKEKGDTDECPIEGRLFFDNFRVNKEFVGEKLLPLIKTNKLYTEKYYIDSCMYFYQVVTGDNTALSRSISSAFTEVDLAQWDGILSKVTLNGKQLEPDLKNKLATFIIENMAFSIDLIMQNLVINREKHYHLGYESIDNIKLIKKLDAKEGLLFPALVCINNGSGKTYFLYKKPKSLPRALQLTSDSHLEHTTDIWVTPCENSILYTQIHSALSPKVSKLEFFDKDPTRRSSASSSSLSNSDNKLSPTKEPIRKNSTPSSSFSSSDNGLSPRNDLHRKDSINKKSPRASMRSIFRSPSTNEPNTNTASSTKGL